MNKKLRIILLFIIILIIGSGTYYLIYLYKCSNIIIVTNKNYITILDEVHNNPDSYVGKKIIVSGYVYIGEGFSEDNFVIAQNIALNPYSPSETFIVGFLCENHTTYKLSSNETIEIKGVIKNGYYNDMEYPIIEVKSFRFRPYINAT